jgi:hypothetical protein
MRRAGLNGNSSNREAGGFVGWNSEATPSEGAKRRYPAHFLSKLTDADGLRLGGPPAWRASGLEGLRLGKPPAWRAYGSESLWLGGPTARKANCKKPFIGFILPSHVPT